MALYIGDACLVLLHQSGPNASKTAVPDPFESLLRRAAYDAIALRHAAILAHFQKTGKISSDLP